MDKLVGYSTKVLNNVTLVFKRYLWDQIDWNQRLIGITGPRGVGKTTLVLQYIKEKIGISPDVLYVSMDDLYFINHSFIDLADQFAKRGGKILVIDEVHKYPGWSREVKNVYDYFNELQVIFTGSSAIEIAAGEADLSRRAILYQLQGLSFREYVNFKYQLNLPSFGLIEILKDPFSISKAIVNEIKPLKYFDSYLRMGYYPFFIEDETNYNQRLAQTINVVLETDIPAVSNIDFNATQNVRKLLGVLTESAPFKPNILKLSQKIGISKESFVKYLRMLEKASIVTLLYKDTRGISFMNKPEKIFLNNPNIIHALQKSDINLGSLRETFFMSMLNLNHKLHYPPTGDFIVDGKYVFEVGGRNKSFKQIKGLQHAYVVVDDIEYSYDKIPLWLFGFLY